MDTSDVRSSNNYISLKANIHHQTMNRSFHYAKKKKVSGWKHRPAWNITFPFLVPKFAWNALDFLSKSFKIIEWSLYSPYKVINWLLQTSYKLENSGSWQWHDLSRSPA